MGSKANSVLPQPNTIATSSKYCHVKKDKSDKSIGVRILSGILCFFFKYSLVVQFENFAFVGLLSYYCIWHSDFVHSLFDIQTCPSDSILKLIRMSGYIQSSLIVPILYGFSTDKERCLVACFTFVAYTLTLCFGLLQFVRFEQDLHVHDLLVFLPPLYLCLRNLTFFMKGYK